MTTFLENPFLSWLRIGRVDTHTNYTKEVHSQLRIGKVDTHTNYTIEVHSQHRLWRVDTQTNYIIIVTLLAQDWEGRYTYKL